MADHGGTAEGSESRFYAGALGLFVVFTTLWLAAWALAPGPLLGWESVVITSGSMQPTIEQGDVIVAVPHSGEGLGPGTVVVFEDPGGLGTVTHRIWAVLDDGTYVTRGDANLRTDSTPLPPENVLAVGRVLVPLIGLPSQWLFDDPPMFVAWLLAMSVAVFMARWAVYPEYDPWRDRTILRHLRREAAPLRHVRPSKWGPVALYVKTSSIAVALAWVMLSVPGSAAAFADTTNNPGSSFTAAAVLGVIDVGVAAPATVAGLPLATIEVPIQVTNSGDITTSVLVYADFLAEPVELTVAPGTPANLTLLWDLTGLPIGPNLASISVVAGGDVNPANDVVTVTVTVGP